jgi:HK97 family phage portal protein
MSWFDIFRKRAQPTTAVALIHNAQAVSSPRDFQNFAQESYSHNSIAYACIDKTGDAIASVKLLLKKKGSTNKEISQHPLLDLLARPNAVQSYQSFVKTTFGYYRISGNAYLKAIGPSPNKPPKEIWNLRPDKVKIVPGMYQLPQAYVYKPQDKEYVYPVDQVEGKSSILHLKTFNPLDSWYGMSPVEAAHYAVDQHNASGKWNLGLLQNSARPSGALIMQATDNNPAGELSHEQQQFLRQQIDEQYTSAGNAGRPLLLYGGMDWKEMGFNPKDMDWLEGKNISARDIALVFGVPSQLLNVPGDSTYANYEQAQMAFYVNTVIPLTKFWVDYLNIWLVPSFDESLYLEPDINTIDALEPLRREKWTQVNGAQFLTINEKREVLGYGRYEESDEPADMLFMPPGVSPLAQALEEEVEDGEDTSDYEAEDDEEGSSGPKIPKTPKDADFGAQIKNEDEARKLVLAGGSVVFLNGKAFDIRDKIPREQYRLSIVNKREAFAKTFRSRLNSHWRKESDLMRKAIPRVEFAQIEQVVDAVVDHMSDQLKSIMNSQILKIMRSFGYDVLKLKSVYGHERKDEETKFEMALEEYIEQQVGSKITKIQRTTRKRVIRELRNTFAESLAEGDTSTEMIKKVATVYKDFTINRAATIVRTETAMAQNYAQREAAKALDIPELRKTWISEMIERSRENHMEMHEKSVGINEQFEVPSDYGVDLMDGPGDSSAPAEQVINCHCVNVFERGTE